MRKTGRDARIEQPLKKALSISFFGIGAFFVLIKLLTSTPRYAWTVLVIACAFVPLSVLVRSFIKSQTSNSQASSTSRARALSLLVSLLVVIASSLVVLPPPSTSVSAATSDELNFQGRLLTGAGSLVSDGIYNVEFNLYYVATGGTSQWTEDRLVTNTQGVTVQDGYFSVYLGEYDAFPGTIDWSEELYLGMTVRGTSNCAWGSCTPADSEMTPRFKLTSVPYAFRAANVASSDADGADSNDVSITTGDTTTSGDSGDIIIDTGSAAGTNGALLFGTANASALTVGSGSSTFQLDSSAFDVSTAGVLSGITGYSQASGNFAISGAGTFSTGTGNISLNGAVTAASTFAVQGASITVGTTTQDGLLVLNEATNDNTVSVSTGTQSVGSFTVSFPELDGNDTFCLLSEGNCTGGTGSDEIVTVAADDSTAAYKAAADYTATATSAEDAINNALDDTGVGRVVLLPGTFTIDGSISIPNNVTLEGSGNSSVIVNGSGSNYDMIVNTDTSTGTGVTVSNLKIDGDRTGTAGNQDAIVFTRMGDYSADRDGATIQNVVITSMEDDGIELIDSDMNIISNVTVIDSPGTAVYLDDSADESSYNVIENSVFTDNDYGVLIGDGANNVVTGNSIINATFDGIRIPNTSGNNTTISNNNILDAGAFGIYIDSSYNTVTGNTIRGGGTVSLASINVARGDNLVSSNSIYDRDGDGIVSTDYDNNVFDGNRIENVGGTTTNNAIVVSGFSDNTQVTNNTIIDSNCSTTCYGIDIGSNTTDTYLSNNYVQNGTINDSSSTTSYAGQATNTTDFVFKPGADSDTTFAIQDAGGGSIFTVDTNGADAVSVQANSVFTGGTTGDALTVNNSTSSGDIVNFQDNGTDVFTIADGGSVSLTGTLNQQTTNTSALLLQSASGAETVLTANTGTRSSGTAGNQIQVGNSTGTDTDLTLFVVDSAAGDPTTNGGAISNGSIYYDSTANKFRCFENSSWVDCIGSGGGGGANTALSNLASVNINAALNATGGNLQLTTTTSGDIQLQPAGNITLGTSDTTGTLLVVDTKTDSGDPTGVNGGIYYNSNLNKLRCYENGTWVDCISTTNETDQAAASFYDNAGSQTISSGSDTVVNIDTTQTNNNGTVYSLATDEITIGEDADYLITYEASGRLNGGTRSGMLVKLELDTGSGFADVDGTSTYHYGRTTSEEQGTAGGSVVLSLNDGDKIRIVAQGTSQAFTTVADASRITFLQLKDGGGLGGGSSLFTDGGATAYLTATSDTLTVGSSTTGGKLFVDGDADEVQLQVQANATQTSDIVVVENSSGVDIFTVDSTSVSIGTSDTTGSLLVLDTKTDSGDPTGLNGALYYNSNLNKFRCYENGAWTDCISSGGGGGGGDTLQDVYDNDTNGGDAVISVNTTDGAVAIEDASTSIGDILRVSSNAGTTDYFVVTDDGIELQASGYINFGTTAGASGYGIRDNNGNLEVKNDESDCWFALDGGGCDGSPTYDLPSFVSDSSISQSVRSSTTVTIPTGTVNGHLLLASITLHGFGTIESTPDTPTGWTLLENVTGGTSGYNQRHLVYYKIAAGDVPGADVTWDHNSGNADSEGRIITIQDVDQTTPISDSSTRTSDSFSTRGIPALDTTGENIDNLGVGFISTYSSVTFSETPDDTVTNWSLDETYGGHTGVYTRTLATATSYSAETGGGDNMGYDYTSIAVAVNSSGAGTIVGNADRRLSNISDVAISADLTPGTSETYDLGSATALYSSLYLADGGGVYLGVSQDAQLSYDEAGDDRVELTGTGASLFIEDRLGLGVDARTIADTGDGSPATLTLNPTSSYVEITCNDSDSCDITMGEADATKGDLVLITNLSANTADFSDSSGVSELSGAHSLGQWDSLTLVYTGDRWIESSYANN